MPNSIFASVAGLAALFLLAGCQATNPNASPAPLAASARTPAPTPAPDLPRDAFVLLSGGGTPTSNNYSQYVQARALANFLRERYPADSVWTFFGVGNRDGEKPALADVYRQIKHEGLLIDTWLPGTLPGNRSAAKDNFLRTLRAEILPRVRGGGTLYLFVGDHGVLTSGKNPESAITMWGLKPDPSQRNGWAAIRDDSLTVSELRQALASGLGSGRVVFVMTQCHSGGFHELGVPREVQPPRAWFSTAPNWLGPTPKRLPLAAGFTATDEASIAAGCDPYPDPDTWAGYERFLPEKLLGRDLLSDAPLPLRDAVAETSFAAAHTAAVLIDQTIDKPRATSEHYLERWATLLETRLARELLLTPRARAALDAYQTAVDTGRVAADDPAWQETQTRFTTFITRMAEQNPATRRLLLTGSRAELEKPSLPRSTRAPRREEDAEDAPARSLSRAQTQLWRDTLRPAWMKALAAGEIRDLPPAVLAFEKRLHPLETRRPAGFADDWSNRTLDELYWSSTYATPEKFDAATAGTLTRWAAERRTAILRWAAASSDSALRDAAAQFGPEFHRARTPPPPPKNIAISVSTAAERALYYRRILAAWAFLLALDHQPALARLTELRALERTPLPPAISQ